MGELADDVGRMVWAFDDEGRKREVRLLAAQVAEVESALEFAEMALAKRRERDARLADVEVAFEAMNEVFMGIVVDEDHVEHIVRDHASDVVAHYRLLARDIRQAEAIINALNNKIVDAMEERAKP